MCLWMDGTKPVPPFPSLPLVCVSAVQWESVPFLGFPGCSDSRESVCNVGRPGFTLWVGKIPRRRKWQSTPVFLPREFHGQRSLVGYSPWDHGIGRDWVTNTYLLNLEATNMNKNIFLSVEGTVIYTQLRLFPFNRIRTHWLRNQLDLVLLQILQSVFPLGGLFIYNVQSQQHTQSITTRLRDNFLGPGKRGCECFFYNVLKTAV